MPATAGPAISERSISEVLRGEEQDVGDARRSDEQHQHPIEAYGDAGRVGHAADRVEELLVERVHGPPRLAPLALLVDEARALLGRVVELREAVAELDSTRVQLDALGDARV